MGVALVVCALLAQAPAEGPAILGVELRLPPGTDPALVKNVPDLVPLRKGQRLSIRAVQRTIERLMGTGNFADVVVTAEEHEDGVELVILASPKLKVGQIFSEGNRALSTGELAAAAKLPTGSELSPETLADALEGVRIAYRRKGYLHAEITAVPTAGELGVDIPLQVKEGEPTRLENVVFTGEPGLSEPKLIAKLELDLGAVVDQENVERAADRLRAFYRKEHFYRARIEAPSLDENGRLTIPIHAGPQYAIRYRGNRSYPDAVLAAVYAYDGSETLDRTVLDRLAQKVSGFYRYRGFHDVDVIARESVRPDGREALLVVDIEEGAPIRVRKVNFEGNHAVSTSELEGVLKAVMQASAPVSTKLTDSYSDALDLQGRVKNPAEFDMPQPPIETVLVDSAYRDATQSMRNLYKDRGYLEAVVELKPIELKGRQANVTFAVSEGRQVLFGDVKYDGGPDDFPPQAHAWEPRGDPFSTRTLEHMRQTAANEVARRGYTYAKVESEWALDAQGAAGVAFHFMLGPQVRVGKVLVRGLLRTDEGVVRSQLVVAEGKTLNPDDLVDSQRNLIALGIFNTAEVRLISPETAEPVKDVLIELQEGKRLTGDWGPGYFLAEGPRIVLDAQYPNAFGEAVALQGHLQLNYFGASALAVTRAIDVSDLNQATLFGGRANLSLIKRGFLFPELGVRADLVGERVFRPSYQFTRVAATVPGFDWSRRFRTGFERLARLKLTLLLQYETELSYVLPVSSLTPAVDLTLPVADQQRLRFSFGTFALSTLRTGFTVDLRDDPVLPHAGGVLSGSIEPTWKIYAVNEQGAPVTVQFLKLQGQLTVYVPIGPAVVLALLARGGYIVPLSSDSVTPPVKRFFVGGASSLRGFSEDGLQPEDVRRGLRGEVSACQALASPYGCTIAARTLLAGSLVPSQGGESFGVGKAELRFPFIGELNVGVFFELGNLWLQQPNSLTLRPVAGTGIRYLSPIGPLALDVGFNLAPDSVVNESPFQVHFNIGVF